MTIRVGFVAGFGRCGTSLVMAMLAAGGLQTVGAAPLFEHPQYIARRTDFRFLRRQNGKVIKWVDPIATIIPHDVVGPVLWLDRDMIEQAKSQIKCANAFGENWPIDAAMIAEVEGQIHTKRNTALARAATVGPVTILTFEELLFDPVGSAKTLREVFQTFSNLDIEAASSVVRSRSPQCAAGMEMTRSEAIASLEEAMCYGRS
jgi:hypothetical protein